MAALWYRSSGCDRYIIGYNLSISQIRQVNVECVFGYDGHQSVFRKWVGGPWLGELGRVVWGWGRGVREVSLLKGQQVPWLPAAAAGPVAQSFASWCSSQDFGLQCLQQQQQLLQSLC
jgi:hypothetical protein